MKIFAYLFSYACAIVSIFFILVQGISFGNEKVSKWLTSLFTSILTSVFLTQPIQVALTAIFFASIFRKGTEFYKDKAEDDKKIPENEDFVEEIENLNSLQPIVGNTASLEYIRLERKKERIVKDILKKLFLHSIFLWILYVTAFSNRDLNSFKYHSSLSKIMTNNVNGFKINSIDDVILYVSINFNYLCLIITFLKLRLKT
jgi:hypothetical protein